MLSVTNNIYHMYLCIDLYITENVNEHSWKVAIKPMHLFVFYSKALVILPLL